LHNAERLDTWRVKVHIKLSAPRLVAL
jgi:hypothetical protein